MSRLSVPLMQAVVDTAVFVGLSPDEVIDPDAAVTFLESLAFTLKQLGEEERAELRAFIARQVGGFGERADFLADLADDLGI